jgi:pimeloyl-ACP methyl ester carboxylesterase
MPYINAVGRTIYAESFGNPDDPSMLLVNGHTSQLTSWPVAFCEAFVDRGFFVMRFDNRDTGLSTKFVDGPEYTLSDMADDCIEVLNHYDATPAHVMGISMGGMIVQTLAIDHPEAVASMTSYASRSGHPDFGNPTEEAMAAMVTPEATTRAEAEARGVAGKHIWGTADTWSEEEWAKFSGDNFDRSPPDGGGARQYGAILASGSRDEALSKIDIPTLVIHGSADTLITPPGGQHTADVIPNAQYLEIEHMGHDIPITEWPQIVQVVTMHASGAGGA